MGCVQYAEGETGVPPEIRRVLFVCSYHSEQIWGRKVLNGVKKQLDRAGCNVDLRVIYLDSKRLTNTEVRNSLLEVQLREVKGKLDLIIVSDEEANNALFSLDIPLVKETPVVFCGVMRYSKKLDFDQVEVFSMLQQISFTSYGRDTFSSLSLLIDSIAIQQDSISKQTADFALVTFAQSLKLTENQKKELIELLNEKYMVSDIKSIDDILYRIKSAMYATNEDANYFKELDTLDSPQSMKLD